MIDGGQCRQFEPVLSADGRSEVKSRTRYYHKLLFDFVLKKQSTALKVTFQIRPIGHSVVRNLFLYSKVIPHHNNFAGGLAN